MVILPFTQKKKKGFNGPERTNPLWTHDSWLMGSNNLDLFWTRDRRGRHSWKMWRTRPKELLVKTCSLKPRTVHSNITNMVIRSVLTYGPTVWWLRVRYIISRTELSKLHRLACLVMKTTSTTAMEAPLGLSPLNMIIETEEQVWIQTPIWPKVKS